MTDDIIMAETTTHVLITWPESQRIMEHPEAVLDLTDLNIHSGYWIPRKIWEQYKDTYYEVEE